MMTSKNDHYAVHAQPIADPRDYGQHQKLLPHEGPNCRKPALAFRSLPKLLSDLATLITDVVFRKAPIYGRLGRIPLRASLREIGLALRAKRFPRSNHPYSTMDNNTQGARKHRTEKAPLRRIYGIKTLEPSAKRGPDERYSGEVSGSGKRNQRKVPF